ncbi:MAG: flavoredoxin [Deltaproteobacteria bacterium HGW-Deltaproteobacteria-8]|nr:MAG: flavoredoxin [Deltaproteobacteria bacterium HGW-Deltaproteobacteria-8]
MKQSLGAKTLAQPTPVWVVGSYDAAGKANIMTAAWGGICCSKPPCVTVSVRTERHTYAAIMARKAFTVSVPSQRHVAEADYVGMISGVAADKFAVTGLTATRSDLVDAPYVEEFPLVIECRLLETVDLGAHTQFIGEILDVKADADILDTDGNIDLARLLPLIYSPGSSKYFGVGPVVAQAFNAGKKYGG